MSWPEVELGALCERVSVGHVGTTSEFYTNDSGVPFLRTQNVNSRGIVLDDVKYITPEFHKKLKKSVLRTGDVVLSRVISTSVNCGVIPASLDGANCANIILARPQSESLDSQYLLHYLRSESAQRKLLSRQVGSAQSVVNTGVLKSWPIPLPPLSEQRRIAAILDKADDLRQKRRQATEKLDQLLQSVFLEIFGDPLMNPKGWETQALDKVAATLKRGPFGGALKKEIFVSEGYAVYEQQHAIYGDFNSVRYFIDENKYKEMKAFSVQPGDLLISCSGTMGRVSIAPAAVLPGVINQALLKIVVDKAYVLNEYLADFIRSDKIQAHLFGISRGSGLKNFPPMSEVKNMLVPCPPIALQKHYIEVKSKIKGISNLCEETKLDTLFSSLQQRAFNGTL